MTNIAKEIEKLANKYRGQKGFESLINNDSLESLNDNKKGFTIDDFLTRDDFDENYLSDLSDEFLSDEEDESGEGDFEIQISDFVKTKENIEGVAKSLLEQNNLKPKNQALNLTKNISKNLRDLKALIRS